MGPSSEIMSIRAGGDAGDWITHTFGIVGAEAELGKWTDYLPDWSPKSISVAKRIVDENLEWLELIYDKLGNQIEIEPVGYIKKKRNEKDVEDK